MAKNSPYLCASSYTHFSKKNDRLVSCTVSHNTLNCEKGPFGVNLRVHAE